MFPMLDRLPVPHAPVVINRSEGTVTMNKTTVRVLTGLAAAVFALGLTPGAAQAAKPRELEIGPVTVCKVITFFDVVIFEYDCYVAG
jgi:hypothetical protein